MSRSSWSRWLASQLELVGHLVEGGAERRGLREAADLDPGAAVAGGESSGRVDQLLQRPPHRGDQAAEEEQGAGQAGDQAGGDEQGGVAGVAGDLVLQFRAALGLGGDRRRGPPAGVLAFARSCTRAAISTW